MNKTFGTLLGSAVLATGMTFAATVMPAQAATFACPTSPVNTAAKVTGSSACEISDTADQDFKNTNPITVNQEAFFGFTDWVFAERQNTPGAGALETTIDLDFTVAGNVQSGTWSIVSNAFTQYDDIMLIFKSGNSTFLTGYLLDATSGNYSTPFTDPPFNLPGNATQRDISHISLYVRGPGTAVPEPLTILGASAAAGFGAAFKRKLAQKKDSNKA